MRRRSGLYIFLIFIAVAAFGNEFIIESFKALPNDMSGSVYAKKDGNNEFCGLIKVKTGISKDLDFDSGLKFSPSEKKNPGEYWVYVSPGEGRLTLFAESFVPKHYQISTVKIESKRTYEMVVRAKEEEKITVSILSDPPDAEKWIDGKLLGAGENFELLPGSHQLTVKKQGCKEYNEIIEVNKSQVLFKDIKLEEIEIQGVNIRSTPSGATVYIDNIEKGKTDLPDWLYPGEYTLKLSLSGYLDITEKIRVEEGRINNFSYTLQKNAGYLNLSVTPSDADIKINGQSYQSGKTELIPGKYRISISKSGYLSQEEEITVELGETITLSYTLVEDVGTLSLQITPSDAKVEINKREYSHSAPIKLSPGTYKIEVSKDGWYAQDEMVTLKLRETLSKRYTLQQKTGTLQFSVQPLDGKVELRDATGKLYKSWTGMRLEKDIPVGSYELTCTYSGYKTEKRNIAIMENQTLPLKIQMEEGVSYAGIEEVLVPGGSFRMGDVWGGGESDEKPVRSVTLRSFYIAKHEVTQALYHEIMGTNPSYFKGDNLPVERVTWYNAVDYCNKLSEKADLQKVYTISGTNVTADFTKNGYRLLTEAEWEYAARSCGRDDRKWSGTNTESELGNYAWYDSNSGSKTHPVGTKKPNDLGIYDMSGNVWEWCWDWYDDYSSSSQTNPTGPSTGSSRVVRGGRWYSHANFCRTADRSYPTPSYSYYNLGFRLARNGD